MRPLLVTAVALFVPAFAVAVPFSGTVEGRDGGVAAPVVIHVEPLSNSGLNYLDLRGPRMPGLQATHVDDAGRFTIDLPAGAHRVWFQSPWHRPLSVILFVGAKDKKLPDVHVALAHDKHLGWFGAPAVIFKEGKKWSKPLEMKEEADGTWSLNHRSESSEARFLLQLNAKEGPEWTPAPGTPLVFDERFLSVVPVVNGEAKIRLDPKALKPTGREQAEVKFSDPASPPARLHELANLFERTRSESWPTDPTISPQDRTKIIRAADAKVAPTFIERMKDRRASKLERELAAVLSLALYDGVDDAAKKRARALLSPTSLAWVALPPARGGSMTVRVGDEKESWGLIEKVSRLHPEPAVRGGAVYLLALRAKKDGNEKRAKRLMQEVRVKYADYDTVKWALLRENRKRDRGAGEPFPELKLATVEGKALDNASFAERHTLIDFSAYGCGACVDIIPELQEVRRAYPEERLRMVTVTIGTTPRSLKEVLANQPPQPWEHVALPDAEENWDRYQAWEVTYYPTLFLIGPDGKIVAIDEDLRKGYPSKIVDRLSAHLPVETAMPPAKADGAN